MSLSMSLCFKGTHRDDGSRKNVNRYLFKDFTGEGFFIGFPWFSFASWEIKELLAVRASAQNLVFLP
ncbi:hypothetical protein D3C76_1847540 [compost metagenome]